MDPADLEHCRAAIRAGSLSFHTASKLLPQRVRDPALALYAFCRLADDAVDLNREKPAAVLRLRRRLDAAYAGAPEDGPADRAFAAMIRDHDMPRALPDALLEGLAWDGLERRYETYSDLLSYCARVASAVGVMMCVLMGVRGRDALARAADLGLAMQLTNIARDIGEDADAARLYIPLEWMAEVELDPELFLIAPRPSHAVRLLTSRLLRQADGFYDRALAGVAALPRDCRPGIFAAARIYRGIGDQIARNDFDSVTQRAHTSKAQKLAWLAGALGGAALSTVTPRNAMIHAKPAPEVAFLVDAAAQPVQRDSIWGAGRAGALLEALAQLEAHDRARRGELLGEGAGAT